MKPEQKGATLRARSAFVGLASALAALALSCSQAGTQSSTSVVDLLPLLQKQSLAAGVVDARSASGRAALGSGWHGPESSGVWASEFRSSLLIASLEERVETLHLELGAPGFIPFEFSVEVSLNGTPLGKLNPSSSVDSYELKLPSGVVHVGLNRLELHSSHVVAPTEFGQNPDTRKLGVRFREARFQPASGNEGRFLHLRIPRGGGVAAEFEGTGTLVVQDAASLTYLAAGTSSKPLELELGDEEGREVIVSAWGDLASLVATGSWKPTSVILIMSDTLREDSLGPDATPALEALAAEGTRFSQTFSHAPMTLPSHTALFSSRYPHVSGVVNNGQQVPQDLPLLADWLSRAGYQTRAVASLGTLWLGRKDASLDRGFRTFQHARGDDAIGTETVLLLERVLDELSPDAPFFLFAHFADPHEPYRDTTPPVVKGTVSIDGALVAEFNPREGPHIDLQHRLDAGKHRIVIECPDTMIRVRSLHIWTGGRWGKRVEREFVGGALMEATHRLESTFELDSREQLDLQIWLADKPKRSEIAQRYGFEVERVDKALGELIDSLKERGLWDNSLVVFTSDHGEALGEHGGFGHVQTLFDELVHVPLIIKAPAGALRGEIQREFDDQQDRLVRHIDLVPTILEVIGQPPLPGQMGRSILTDEGSLVLLTETHAPEAKQDLYAFRDEQFKLIYAPETGSFQMFDCMKDPLELNDVFDVEGDKRSEWQMLLRSMAKRWEAGDQAGVDEGELDRLRAMGYL